MKYIMHLGLITSTFWVALHSPELFGKRKYGMAGCGLGSAVMGSGGGQISAATTNGLGVWPFDTQNVGITLEMSNCVPDGSDVASGDKQQFMLTNYATLSKEMAQGSGDTLSAYAETFGCSKEAYPVFAEQMQKSYAKLFAAPGALATLEATREELSQNSTLKEACSTI